MRFPKCFWLILAFTFTTDLLSGSTSLMGQEVESPAPPANFPSPVDRELAFLVAESLITEAQADAINQATKKLQVKMLEPVDANLMNMIGKDFRKLPPKLREAIYTQAEAYAEPGQMKAIRQDDKKTQSLMIMLRQKEVIRFLNQQFSLSADQRELLGKKLASIWNDDLEKSCSRLRFDGFPGSGQFTTHIELETLLNESQWELFQAVKTVTTQLGQLRNQAKVDSESWKAELTEQFNLCIRIELEKLNEFREIPEAEMKRFSVAGKKIISDQIKEREEWFKQFNQDMSAAISRSGFSEHFFHPPMTRLKSSKVWMNTCKKLLNEKALKTQERDEADRKELEDLAITYSNLLNFFEATRCKHRDIQAVFNLSSRLNQENFPTEIPGWHTHRILEIEEKELKNCLSESGWKNIKPNVDRLRQYRLESIATRKAQQKALEEELSKQND